MDRGGKTQIEVKTNSGLLFMWLLENRIAEKIGLNSSEIEKTVIKTKINYGISSIFLYR